MRKTILKIFLYLSTACFMLVVTCAAVPFNKRINVSVQIPSDHAKAVQIKNWIQTNLSALVDAKMSWTGEDMTDLTIDGWTLSVIKPEGQDFLIVTFDVEAKGEYVRKKN